MAAEPDISKLTPLVPSTKKLNGNYAIEGLSTYFQNSQFNCNNSSLSVYEWCTSLTTINTALLHWVNTRLN